MKRILSSFLLMSAMAFAQTPTPIQLELVPTPPPPQVIVRPIQVKPFDLSPSAVASLMTAVAGTGLMQLPAGTSMSQIQSVYIRPITSGSNAGGVTLNVMLYPTPTPTPSVTGS